MSTVNVKLFPALIPQKKKKCLGEKKKAELVVPDKWKYTGGNRRVCLGKSEENGLDVKEKLLECTKRIPWIPREFQVQIKGCWSQCHTDTRDSSTVPELGIKSMPREDNSSPGSCGCLNANCCCSSKFCIFSVILCFAKAERLRL